MHKSLLFIWQVKRTNFEERTLVVHLSLGIDHETDIWKVSNNAYSKTSAPQAVKLEHFRTAIKVILSPVCESSVSGVSSVIGKRFKMQCHPLLLEIAAGLPKSPVLSDA